MFHITRVCNLRVYVVVVYLVCLFCLLCSCDCVCVSYHTCVYIARVFCVRHVCVFVVECVLVGRMVVYAFAFVCCKVAFHVAHVCRLHVRVAFVIWFVCFCLYACCACGCVCVCHCMLQGLRFIVHVCFAFVYLACLRLCACFVCNCVCVCFCMLPCCVSYYTCESIACVFCVRAAGLFDCACMLGLRVIVCRFQACVHIRRVCILQVWFAFVVLVCLLVLVCLFCV